MGKFGNFGASEKCRCHSFLLVRRYACSSHASDALRLVARRGICSGPAPRFAGWSAHFARLLTSGISMLYITYAKTPMSRQAAWILCFIMCIMAVRKAATPTHRHSNGQRCGSKIYATLTKTNAHRRYLMKHSVFQCSRRRSIPNRAFCANYSKLYATSTTVIGNGLSSTTARSTLQP